VQYLENQMAVALGGRIAEELIFGEDDITTGAGGDFQQVTRTARMMIEQMGFSEELGQVAWGGGGGGPSFLGAQAGQSSEISQTTRDKIDVEVSSSFLLLPSPSFSKKFSSNRVFHSPDFGHLLLITGCIGRGFVG
jgi:ATP-dependent Zn protease